MASTVLLVLGSPLFADKGPAEAWARRKLRETIAALPKGSGVVVDAADGPPRFAREIADELGYYRYQNADSTKVERGVDLVDWLVNFRRRHGTARAVALYHAGWPSDGVSGTINMARRNHVETEWIVWAPRATVRGG